MPIATATLLQFLKKHDHAFTNRHGLEFKPELDSHILVSLPLEKKSGFTASLTAEYRLEEFMKTCDLHSIPGLQDFSLEKLMAPYLKGHGELNLKIEYPGIDLGFRIIGKKTIIYSLYLHFYDENYDILETPQDFTNYLNERENLLQAAMECQNKLSNAGRRWRHHHS